MALPSTTTKNKNNEYLLTETEFNNTPVSDFNEGDEVKVYQPDGIPESDLSSSVKTKLNAILQGTTAPTTSTVGYIGQLYVDTTNAKLYKCISVASSIYTWQEVGGSGNTYLHNISIGTSTDNVQFSLISSRATSYTNDDLPNNLYNIAGCISYLNGGQIPPLFFYGIISSMYKLATDDWRVNISSGTTRMDEKTFTATVTDRVTQL